MQAIDRSMDKLFQPVSLLLLVSELKRIYNGAWAGRRVESSNGQVTIGIH